VLAVRRKRLALVWRRVGRSVMYVGQRVTQEGGDRSMNDELKVPGQEVTVSEYLEKLIAAGDMMTSLITAVGDMNAQRGREQRDSRWAEEEYKQKQFYLRMGLERAQDKAGFLRKHCGLR
jgi:hypothetical protein